MNTYLIPVTKEFCKTYTDIMVIYANTSKEAYFKAKNKKGLMAINIRNYKEVPYESYIGELKFKNDFFPIYKKNDMIKNIQLLKEDNIMEIIDIYDYMYWGDYNAQIQKLAEKALPEKWSFEDKDDNYILKNYLKYTFKKLQEENKVIETDTYCAFDTGLFSLYYDPIYAYGEINKSTVNDAPKWYFKGFKDIYELGSLDIENFLKELITFQILLD